MDHRAGRPDSPSAGLGGFSLRRSRGGHESDW